MSERNTNPWQKPSSLDQWSSVKYSLRDFVTSTALTTSTSSASKQPNYHTQTTHSWPSQSKSNTHDLKIIPSFSVASICPSLSESTSTQQSQSSAHHINNTPPLQSFPSRKPIKSAMKKSTGSYGMKQGGKAPLHPSQCIPSGLGGGSIVMPSGGGYQQSQQHHQQQQQVSQTNGSTNNANNTNGGANGYISPQYGWYISMTPPTPPHFHESSSNTKDKNDENQYEQKQPQQSSSTTTSQTGNNTRYQSSLQHQHHFQNNNGNGFTIQNQQLLPPLHQQQYNMNMSMSNHKLGRFPKTGQEMNTTVTRPVFTRSLKGVPHDTSGWPSVPL